MAERLRLQLAVVVGIVMFSLNLSVWSMTLLDPTATTQVLAQLFPTTWPNMDATQTIQWAWYVHWTLYLLAGMVSTCIGILGGSLTWTALMFLARVRKPTVTTVRSI